MPDEAILIGQRFFTHIKPVPFNFINTVIVKQLMKGRNLAYGHFQDSVPISSLKRIISNFF